MKDTIPTARLEEIRELAAKATPGPVTANDYDFPHDPICSVQTVDASANDGCKVANFYGPDRVANAAIYLDPQTISAIVSELIERRNKDAEPHA